MVSFTDRAFDRAYDNAMPESGEGWGAFANFIRADMERLEAALIRIRDHDRTDPDAVHYMAGEAHAVLAPANTGLAGGGTPSRAADGSATNSRR